MHIAESARALHDPSLRKKKKSKLPPKNENTTPKKKKTEKPIDDEFDGIAGATNLSAADKIVLRALTKSDLDREFTEFSDFIAGCNSLEQLRQKFPVYEDNIPHPEMWTLYENVPDHISSDKTDSMGGTKSSLGI